MRAFKRRFVCKVSFTICFIFANPAIALFTLIISGGSFEPSIDQRATLVKVLTAVRIWIVVAGLAFYSWKNATNQPSAMVMGVLTTVACKMFLEDYMVLDGYSLQLTHLLKQWFSRAQTSWSV